LACPLPPSAAVSIAPSLPVIPGAQTVNIKFDVPYSYNEYNASASQSDAKDIEFAGKRMKEINGFKFFDYSNRYEIDCPKWPITPGSAQSPTAQ
jgi:hypothetical protein